MTRGKAAAVLAAFAASFVVVLATPWCTRDRVQEPAVFVDAVRAATAAGLVKAGDVVLVHPPWRDDVVAALRAAAARSTGVLPERARATTAFAPRHGEPLPPLVVVTDDGLPLPRSLRRRVDDEQALRHGQVQVFRVEDARGDGGADARDLALALSDAHVEVRPPGGAAPVVCAWNALQQRHSCPGLPEWMYVGVQELPVGGARTRCVWAHPIGGGVVSVRWPRPLLLDELRLELALTDGAADNARASAVDAELLVDDSSLAHLTKSPGRRGFSSVLVPVGPAARSAAALELRITTANDGQRHTCFRLTTTASSSEEAR